MTAMNLEDATTALFTAISNLQVSGLTILDVTEIPEEAIALGPVLIPNPYGLITGSSCTHDGFGPVWTVVFTLQYALLSDPVGAGRGLASVVSRAMALAFRFEDAVLAIHTDPAFSFIDDIKIPNIGTFGPIQDPTGHQYYGANIEIEVTLYLDYI
jgi:hypothetical protein